MELLPRPNFFIVGAPKSGTTALWSYLKEHPQIFMSPLKEPQFFAADIRGHQRSIRSLGEYLHCFKGANAVAIGEASTCYLGSPGAAAAIREFSPQARVIVMLRNPIDVMYAQHSECLFDGTEQIVDFAAALSSTEPRVWRSGRFKGQPVVGLSYRELVKFSEQVCRFIDVFRRPNVHVIVYDNLQKDPRSVYLKVLAFLGIHPHHECGFDVVHANRQIRSVAVQDLLRHPPTTLRLFSRAFLPEQIRHRLGTYLNSMNVKFVPRPSLEQAFRRQLQREFGPEVQRLGKLVDRDFSAWINE